MVVFGEPSLTRNLDTNSYSPVLVYLKRNHTYVLISDKSLVWKYMYIYFQTNDLFEISLDKHKQH